MKRNGMVIAVVIVVLALVIWKTNLWSGLLDEGGGCPYQKVWDPNLKQCVPVTEATVPTAICGADMTWNSLLEECVKTTIRTPHSTVTVIDTLYSTTYEVVVSEASSLPIVLFPLGGLVLLALFRRRHPH